MEAMVVEAAFAELLVADPAVADRDEVAVIVRRSSQVRSWLASSHALADFVQSRSSGLRRSTLPR